MLTRLLDWADAHPLGALAALALGALLACSWILFAPLPADPDLGTSDIGDPFGSEFAWTPEGGYRRPGDPGPRRIGDGAELDPASGLRRP